MENYKIIIPIENEDEEEKLKKIAESLEGIEVSIGATRNLNGAFVAEVCGYAKDMVEFAGSVITLYVFFRTKRVQIVDHNNNNIKNNIKLKDVATFLKNLIP